MSIRQKMEDMQEQARLNAPQVDISKAVTPAGQPMPLPIDFNARPVKDYDEIIRDNRTDAEVKVRAMASVVMGSSELMDDPHVSDMLEIDIDSLWQIANQIVMVSDSISNVNENIQMFGQTDTEWYIILGKLNDQQNKNVAHRNKVLSEMRKRYAEVSDMYRLQYPDKFDQPSEVKKSGAVISNSALNDLAQKLRDEQAKQAQARMEQERKIREKQILDAKNSGEDKYINKHT